MFLENIRNMVKTCKRNILILTISKPDVVRNLQALQIFGCKTARIKKLKLSAMATCNQVWASTASKHVVVITWLSTSPGLTHSDHPDWQDVRTGTAWIIRNTVTDDVGH